MSDRFGLQLGTADSATLPFFSQRLYFSLGSLDVLRG